MERKAWMDDWDAFVEVKKKFISAVVENGLMITQNIDRFSHETGADIGSLISQADPEIEYRNVTIDDGYRLVFIRRQKYSGQYGTTNLEAARIRYDMSIEDLAKAADVHRNIIYRIEKRERSFNNLRLETAMKIADAFGCNVEDLMDK